MLLKLNAGKSMNNILNIYNKSWKKLCFLANSHKKVWFYRGMYEFLRYYDKKRVKESVDFLKLSKQKVKFMWIYSFFCYRRNVHSSKLSFVKDGWISQDRILVERICLVSRIAFRRLGNDFLRMSSLLADLSFFLLLKSGCWIIDYWVEYK